MSEELECESPPFPKETTHLPRLLECLAELREWMLGYREWANMAYHEIGGDGDVELIPGSDATPNIPTLQYYQLIAVLDMYQAHMSMRMLRESWDKMIRTWERDWDHQQAVIWRLRCLRWAYFILCNAFIDPETREAKTEDMKMRMVQFQRRMAKELHIPKEILGEENDFFGFLFGNDEEPEDDDEDELTGGLDFE